MDSEKPNGPRSSKGVRTRARLVEAAKLVFEENGFLDARISDIGERAGLSHGSFYHYFESKEEIFLEVAEAQEQRFSRSSLTQSGVLDGDGLSRSTVAELIEVSIRRFLEEYRADARIMGVIEQVSRYHEPVRRVRSEHQEQYLRQVERAIHQLQRQGWADPALDPGITASALVAMVARFAELWFVQETLDCPFDDGVEQLASLCLNVLKLREPDADHVRRDPVKAR